MFADAWRSAGEYYMMTLLFIAAGFWAFGRLLKKHDPDEKVKGAARGAAVRFFTNLFTKK